MLLTGLPALNRSALITRWGWAESFPFNGLWQPSISFKHLSVISRVNQGHHQILWSAPRWKKDILETHSLHKIVEAGGFCCWQWTGGHQFITEMSPINLSRMSSDCKSKSARGEPTQTTCKLHTERPAWWGSSAYHCTIAQYCLISSVKMTNDDCECRKQFRTSLYV